MTSRTPETTTPGPRIEVFGPALGRSTGLGVPVPTAGTRPGLSTAAAQDSAGCCGPTGCC